MAHRSEMPKSIRIRTGEGNEWRYDAIQGAADYYEVNKSNAAAFACDDIVGFVEAIEDILARDDLTAKQVREIAETINDHTRAVEFEVARSVDVVKSP
ncbi:hypothetical protein [Haladaptatus sp. DYF46]|uniref:DUF7692 domain-containing protein n=1 Tax=Haladaptatus sp. DYF46 TaxID=2886041 RepID=UPI001E6300A3|nr:hypothetical protein [Haladaptatus sp. DYF46]